MDAKSGYFNPVTQQDRAQFFTVNIPDGAELIASLLLTLVSSLITCMQLNLAKTRGTQREYSSKSLNIALLKVF